uniref:2-polyprenylphenol 6-hydroxylase n=1 Tax=Pararhizobium sp. IMCC3301 TaxID=3067904 RepID=UPI0027425628|nr:2-polyprenylphenol 6-hydroxylase [Pararhizobium sp. IMCC3301]
MSAPLAYLRLVKAGFVLAREGVFSLLPREDAPLGARIVLWCADLIAPRDVDHKSKGDRLNAALNRLGPSYIKLGQFLATRPDIVGPDIADGLGKLRDEVPPFADATARQIIESNLNRTVDQLYRSFSAPVAAASIAQVHKAATRDGDTESDKQVAVKVLRPDVRQRFHKDLESFYAAARLLQRLDPSSRRLRPVAVVDTLARSVTMEMDLRIEAAALSEMADIAVDDPHFAVPAVDWDRTGRDVLTIDWIDGLKLTELDALKAAGHNTSALATNLIQIFLRHALNHGFFHADMHQGNLFVDAQSRIVAIDFGIMGRIGPKERKFLAEILYGFIKRDYLRVAEVHFEAGYVPATQSVADFAQALRAVGEPIHGQSAQDISMAKLLGLLFEITELFDMQTRTELLMLQKTMVVVEGVSRSLDSSFDMWTASEPVLRDWLTRNLGPGAKIDQAASGLSSLGRLINELPALADRAAHASQALDEMAANGLRLDDRSLQLLAKYQARETRASRVALAVVALSVAAVALAYVF